MTHDELITQPTNVMVIGLGTTGASYVDRIIGTLKLHGPLPPNEVFIAVDSHIEALQNLSNVDTAHKIEIQRPAGQILMKNDPSLPDEYLSFVPPAGGGAGLDRRLGLAFYRFNRAALLSRITQIALDMMKKGTPNFQIILITALFGGTGSTFLIELALDLIAWLQSSGMKGEQSITGIGILPRRDSLDILRANAMATLKEITFIRRVTRPANIGGRSYTNPFRLFFLVSTDKLNVDVSAEVEDATARLLVDLGFIPYRWERDDLRQERLDWANILTNSNKYQRDFSSFSTYAVSLPVAEVKWLIDSEREIAQDTVLLKETEMALDEIIQSLQAIESEKEDYLKLAKDLTEQVQKLREAVGKGFPKYTQELENAQHLLSQTQTTLETVVGQINNLRDKVPKEFLTEVSRLLMEQDQKRTRFQNELTRPDARMFSLRLPITEKDFEFLRDKSITLLDMNLEEISKILGKSQEYMRFVTRPLDPSRAELLDNSKALVNYAITGLPGSFKLDADVANTLQTWGLATKDKDGYLVLPSSKIGYVLIIASSSERNIKTFQPMTQPLVQNAGGLAELAEAKIIDSKVQKHAVIYYSLLIGLPLYENNPQVPPRLEDLQLLSTAYDAAKSGTKIDIMTRHAFLYGLPDAFRALTGVSLARLSKEEQNKRVLEFWTAYEIIEPKSRIYQLFVALATVHSRLISASARAQGILDRVQAIYSQPMPTQYDITGLGGLHTMSLGLLRDLQSFADWSLNLQSETSGFAEMIDKTIQGMSLMKGLGDEFKKEVEDIAKRLEETVAINNILIPNVGKISSTIATDVNSWLVKLQAFLGGAPPERMNFTLSVQQVSNDANYIRNALMDVAVQSQSALPSLQKLKSSLEDMRQQLLKL